MIERRNADFAPRFRCVAGGAFLTELSAVRIGVARCARAEFQLHILRCRAVLPSFFMAESALHFFVGTGQSKPRTLMRKFHHRFPSIHSMTLRAFL